MHILLTGATGYIGSRLLDMAIMDGAAVTILGSVPSRYAAAPNVRGFAWRLGDPVPATAFAAWSAAARVDAAVDAVLHLAHDWKGLEGADEINRAGTQLLRDAARAAAVPRFVYVSSMSARPDALNRYGRIKAAVESLLQAPSEIAARIGLVYGGPPLGLYGTMLAITRLAPVLPMVDAGQLVQPIQLDEVCRGLLTLAARSDLGRPVYGLASDHAMSFGTFLKLLARHVHQKSLLVVPFPRWLALLLADLSAHLPGPTIDRERILGLAGIRVRPTAEDLRDLNLTVRPVEEALTLPFRRRRLIQEGMTLLAYCAGERAKPATVRLYVRDLARLGETEPLELPGWARSWPTLVRLLDAGAPRASMLRTRLGIAARVAEASPEPAERFHMTGPTSRVALLTRLTGLVLVESCLLAVRMARRSAGR